MLPRPLWLAPPLLAALAAVAPAARAEPPLASEMVAREAPRARLWWLGWSAGFAAVASAESVVAWARTEHELRAPAQVGTVTALIGVVSTLVLVPPVVPGAATVAAAPPAERERVAAQVLRDEAEIEALGRSWLAHAGAFAVNASAAAWLAWHEDLPAQAAAGLAVGVLVAETKIATQPVAVRDAVAGWPPQVALAPFPLGVAVVGAF